jgi:hypothetical protein
VAGLQGFALATRDNKCPQRSHIHLYQKGQALIRALTLPQGLQNDGHGGRTIRVLLSVWSASKCLKTPESENIIE